jgi:hypothetical protein
MVCPDRERRNSLSDDEFWKEVFGIPLDIEGPLTESEAEAIENDWYMVKPCVQCGATGPCAYDAEGRPLIHADSQEIGE